MNDRCYMLLLNHDAILNHNWRHVDFYRTMFDCVRTITLALNITIYYACNTKNYSVIE